MGQLITNDRSKEMVIQSHPNNVMETRKSTSLLLFKCVEVPYYEKVYQYQNYKKIEVTYKFLADTFVHLQLIKQKAKQEQGCPFLMGNQIVYGYKFKKNEKSDKIRSDKIFFRRKLFSTNAPPFVPKHREKLKNGIKSRSRGKQQENNRRRQSRTRHFLRQQTQRVSPHEIKEQLLKKLAELKFLSKLEIGAKMARIIDGSDGILTESYVQFYSEIPIQKGEFQKKQLAEKQKLYEKIKNKGLQINPETMQMAYSVFQKQYILKQIKPIRNQDQKKENRSIKYMAKSFEEEINIMVCKLDVLTNMMTSIQNHLSYRDADRAMEKFEDVMANLEESQRLAYAEQMAQMLGKNSFFKPYQKEVSSFISSSRSSLAQSRNLSSSRFGDRRARSPDSSNESYDSFSSSFRNARNNSDFQSRNPISPVTTSPKSTAPLRYSDCQSPRVTHNSDRQNSSNEWQSPKNVQTRDSDYSMWEAAFQRLKAFINESNKIGIGESLTCLKNLAVLSPTQIEVEYAKLLMENAKTKYAKTIFQRILYLKKNGKEAHICSEVQSMLAFLYYSKPDYLAAFQHYQKALTQRFKFRNYSRKTAIIFNNMSVIEFFLQRYQKSLMYLHRGLRLGEYCPDYELVMRNNNAMILAEQGKLKQAKMQMYKTYKNIEPYSNMQILSKFYNNLGYFQMYQKVYEKAKLNFDSALQIETKYLIPNGYRPSISLHNNLAIYNTKVHNKHKMIDWKKAAFYLYKVENQLNQLQGIVAVQIHFNFGKILKNDFKKLDEAQRHFFESKNKLLKLKQSLIMLYLEKINAEIDKIQTQRIEEQSEQSSYANKLSKVSKSHISYQSHKQIDSKIIN